MTAVSSELDVSLADEFASWGVVQGGCAVIDESGAIAFGGNIDEVVLWASVTKIAAALAVLDVVADRALDLDAPAGPPGATVRHLLGHASGLAFDENRVLAAPGTRRVYSNIGIELAVQQAVAASGARDAAQLLAERVFIPLHMMDTTLVGSPARGACGPVVDLARLAYELLQPEILNEAVITQAITVSYPGLVGVLPGFGRQEPNDFGLGIELRARKAPHWMPASLSANAFGHFGQSGSFLWVDRELGLSAVALTGTEFGPWAAEAWPVSSQRWIDTVRAGRSTP